MAIKRTITGKRKGKNIIISRDDFDWLLICLANQKFLDIPGTNTSELTKQMLRDRRNMQRIIDKAYSDAIHILYPK